jgi:hypothetical protein
MTKRNRTEYRRQYYLANREKAIKQARQWNQSNPERRQKIVRRYATTDPEKYRKLNRLYRARRRKRDPIFRLKSNLRCRIYTALSRVAAKKTRHTMDIIGCSVAVLRMHIAGQFRPGMSWSNYGEWHLDHVIPLAEASTKEAVEKLCHYTNLAPLWAEENFRKGARRTVTLRGERAAR